MPAKVQQGSHLVPLLFELMLDALDKVICNPKGSQAPRLMSEDVPLMLFADDLMLISTSEQGVQRG